MLWAFFIQWNPILYFYYADSVDIGIIWYAIPKFATAGEAFATMV